MTQSSLSRNLSFKTATLPETLQHGKQVGFPIHYQHSSSTQSTGQSYPEVSHVGESKSGGNSTISKESGCSGTRGKPEEGNNDDCVLPPSFVDHRQSFGRTPTTHPKTYFSWLIAAYGAYPLVHPQIISMTSTRVPLPLDYPQDEPIYVNAKQYHAILRRRQYRARLEAQNKLVKIRKPYLHESRHRHALNRARGAGGRFLNEKKIQEPKPTAMTDRRDNSGPGPSQLTSKAWESKVHQLENYMEGDPTTSSSDITSASDIDHTFHQQEFGFSFYTSPFVESTHHDVVGIQHRYLSVPR